VDRPGVRIAVASKSAYDLFLSRNLRTLTWCACRVPQAYETFTSQKLDALCRTETPAPRRCREAARIARARGTVHYGPAGDRHPEGTRSRGENICAISPRT
jgi:hypothetical protein